MTPEDMLNHDAVSRNGVCHICEKPFACAADSVRDHCHITGKYRGAAHNACNLKLRLHPNTTAIPVVFHNLRGCDSHLLIQVMSRVKGRVSCIPNNTEKYISFSLGQFRFIDSAKFLLASLDKLVAANPAEAFQITARYEPNQQLRELLLRKAVYPYEHMESWGRFAETQLPPKASFYSKLTGEHISDEDYAHAQKVWEAFCSQNMGDYCDLYCGTDVLLLADVFEAFRKTCMKNTAWTLHTTIRARGYPGMHYSRRQAWSSSCSQTMTSIYSSKKGCEVGLVWSANATPKLIPP